MSRIFFIFLNPVLPFKVFYIPEVSMKLYECPVIYLIIPIRLVIPAKTGIY